MLNSDSPQLLKYCIVLYQSENATMLSAWFTQMEVVGT